jgi:8-oxo-dGTP diphosphatase
VNALIQHDGRLLLIRERQPGRSPQWVLPGGRAEPGELLHEALIREVREETGLTVSRATGLPYVSQFRVRGDDPGWSGVWTAYTFLTDRPSGRLSPADPDGKVLQAAWVSLDEALAKLSPMTFRPRRDPLLAHLTGRTDPTVTTLWLWTEDPTADPLIIPTRDDAPATLT